MPCALARPDYGDADCTPKAVRAMPVYSEEGDGAGQVRVRRSEDEGAGAFEVLAHGRVVAYGCGFRFFAGMSADNRWPAGRVDLTGDGADELVVSHWGGGANCCVTHLVFRLSPTVQFLGKVEAGYGDGAVFADLDGDGRVEIVVHDYFKLADYPMEGRAFPVIHRIGGNRIVIAADLARKPPPTRQSFSTCKALLDDRSAWELLGEMAYSGNLSAAWRWAVRLLHDPQGRALLEGGYSSRREDTALRNVRTFFAALRDGPHWQEVAVLASVPVSKRAVDPWGKRCRAMAAERAAGNGDTQEQGTSDPMAQ